MEAEEQQIKQHADLYLKYLSGRLSEEEVVDLEEKLPYWEQMPEQLDSPEWLNSEYRHYEEITPVAKAWERLERKMQKRKKVQNRIWAYGVAAAAVVIVWVSAVFLSSSPFEETEILPPDVHEKALVSLVIDGSEEVLKLGASQAVKLRLNYIRDEHHTLIYDSVVPELHQEEWHTLSVGEGGEYRLVLSDGTVVWLNAGSSLRYPVVFTGEKRTVELFGEGFFQVARNEQQPFVVKTGDWDVRVLGTVFNVMNYANEPCAHVTLVSGKVCVDCGDKEVILAPEQQAVIGPEGVSTRQVESRYYISWIGDRFLFDEEPLEMIVQKLARWYNLDFTFEDTGLKNTCFTGALPKYEDISKAFELLEMTTNVHFVIKQQTITIMRKK